MNDKGSGIESTFRLLILGIIIIFLSFSLITNMDKSNIFKSDVTQPRHEHFSIHSENETDCLNMATESFSEVCNDVLKDKARCLAVWDATEISYDAENKKCIISIPVEKEDEK